jgi:hypothetical protein
MLSLHVESPQGEDMCYSVLEATEERSIQIDWSTQGAHREGVVKDRVLDCSVKNTSLLSHVLNFLSHSVAH